MRAKVNGRKRSDRSKTEPRAVATARRAVAHALQILRQAEEIVAASVKRLRRAVPSAEVVGTTADETYTVEDWLAGMLEDDLRTLRESRHRLASVQGRSAGAVRKEIGEFIAREEAAAERRAHAEKTIHALADKIRAGKATREERTTFRVMTPHWHGGDYGLTEAELVELRRAALPKTRQRAAGTTRVTRAFPV